MPDLNPTDEALDGLISSFRALEGLARLCRAIGGSKAGRDEVDFEGLGELIQSLAQDVHRNTEVLLARC